MKTTKNCIKIITIVLSLSIFFSFKAYARFNYSQSANGDWTATTTTNNKDGLGQLLREMGVQPNWSDRSWVNDIRNRNPSVIDSKGNILRYGETLNIPLHALSKCDGYSKLVIKLSGISSEKNKVTQEAVTPPPAQTPPVIAPSPQPSPKINEGMIPVQVNTFRFFHLWAGPGLSSANNEDTPSDTSTSLNTDASYHFGSSLSFKLTPKIVTELFVQADYRKYKEPENLTINQNKKLYLNYGFNLSYWLSSSLRLGLFAESANTPRSILTSSTVITVTNDSFIKLGPSIMLPFSISHPSDLTLGLRPSFILSNEIDGIEYDNGFGLKTIVNYYFKSSPIYIGLDLNYENQSYNNADNNLMEGYIKVGYSL